MSKKAIIFDMYGTLVSTGNGSVTATKKILDNLCVSIDPQAFYQEWKQTQQRMTSGIESFVLQVELFSRSLDYMFSKYSVMAKSEDYVHFMLTTLGNRTVFSDTLPAIDGLRKKYKVIIGSTSDTDPLLKDININGIHVDSIFTSESLRVYKPKKEFYLQILSETSLGVDDVVFVGDSMIDDIQGPQSIGIPAILIDRDNRYDVHCNITPDAIIRQLTDLLSLEL